MITLQKSLQLFCLFCNIIIIALVIVGGSEEGGGLRFRNKLNGITDLIRRIKTSTLWKKLVEPDSFSHPIASSTSYAPTLAHPSDLKQQAQSINQEHSYFPYFFYTTLPHQPYSFPSHHHQHQQQDTLMDGTNYLNSINNNLDSLLLQQPTNSDLSFNRPEEFGSDDEVTNYNKMINQKLAASNFANTNYTATASGQQQMVPPMMAATAIQNSRFVLGQQQQKLQHGNMMAHYHQHDNQNQNRPPTLDYPSISYAALDLDNGNNNNRNEFYSIPQQHYEPIDVFFSDATQQPQSQQYYQQQHHQSSLFPTANIRNQQQPSFRIGLGSSIQMMNGEEVKEESAAVARVISEQQQQQMVKVQEAEDDIKQKKLPLEQQQSQKGPQSDFDNNQYPLLMIMSNKYKPPVTYSSKLFKSNSKPISEFEPPKQFLPISPHYRYVAFLGGDKHMFHSLRLKMIFLAAPTRTKKFPDRFNWKATSKWPSTADRCCLQL